MKIDASPYRSPRFEGTEQYVLHRGSQGYCERADESTHSIERRPDLNNAAHKCGLLFLLDEGLAVVGRGGCAGIGEGP